ncbi:MULTISPECIES: bifunctional serine/threonine-protein kinase/ABC transporter substrate-binding protein [unclassified Streptomyces]|uniref:bifunctional serine/threonine-protein kinase/ABC transporter substrate-binding protein n=1 Tax=unclassified Streptomyces TaxID=2593676 RepID=UPI00383020F0
MQPLRPSDPARIAGHRLLGRLGAGGMGVVYLARTPGGALVALKVLLTEYAEEPGFRQRFRREVEIARRVGSRCVVPLVDADPDADAPWLATAFVPGPSLAEAVTAYGPLPEHGVRLLGARLAEALAAVHRAGLVHRDLKPGNVLIAHDGPRLIDFGIARAPEDQTLTATGMVVGTPGYLSPEQAEGRTGERIGPPSDVFSLGCVLVYAATGRAPFGTGPADALLYRAVHDPADLDGVPAGLLGLLHHCLAKDPGLRPDAPALVHHLTDTDTDTDAGAGGGADTDASPNGTSTSRDHASASRGDAGDPRGDAGSFRDSAGCDGVTRAENATTAPATEATPVHAPTAETLPADADADADAATTDATPTDTPATEATPRHAPAAEALPVHAPAAGGGKTDDSDEAAGWLPEPVARLIAARSAAALALPDIEHTLAPAGIPAGTPAAAGQAGPGTGGTAEAAGAREARPTGRRRFLLGAGGAAVLAAGGGGAWWAAARDNGAGHGNGTAGPRRPTHTLALHGDLSGPQQATGRAQERGLRLAVEEFNARRDAPFTVKVEALDDKGDPAVSARVAKRLTDDPSVLAVVGPTTDETGQTALAAYDAALVPVVGVSPGTTALSVQGFRSFLHARLPDAVLPIYVSAYLRGDSRSRKIGIVVDRPSGTYGTNLASSLSNALNSIPFPSVPEVVSAMRHDFGSAVDTVLTAGADSVFFAGLPDRAALIARTLRERAFVGPRVSGPALLDERFLTAAREDAEGWVIVAPVIDATRKPEARAFAAAYRKRFDEAPPRYAAEAYDVTGMLLTALAGLPTGRRTRQNLLTAVRDGTYQGITRTYAFQKNGIIVLDSTGGFLWHAENGTFVYDGPAPITA